MYLEYFWFRRNTRRASRSVITLVTKQAIHPSWNMEMKLRIFKVSLSKMNDEIFRKTSQYLKLVEKSIKIVAFDHENRVNVHPITLLKLDIPTDYSVNVVFLPVFWNNFSLIFDKFVFEFEFPLNSIQIREVFMQMLLAIHSINILLIACYCSMANSKAFDSKTFIHPETPLNAHQLDYFKGNSCNSRPHFKTVHHLLSI